MRYLFFIFLLLFLSNCVTNQSIQIKDKEILCSAFCPIGQKCELEKISSNNEEETYKTICKEAKGELCNDNADCTNSLNCFNGICQ